MFYPKPVFLYYKKTFLLVYRYFLVVNFIKKKSAIFAFIIVVKVVLVMRALLAKSDIVILQLCNQLNDAVPWTEAYVKLGKYTAAIPRPISICAETQITRRKIVRRKS